MGRVSGAHWYANAPMFAAARPMAPPPPPTRENGADHNVQQQQQPPPRTNTGHNRPFNYHVSIDRPIEAVPNFLTNVVEVTTGSRDERTGRALTQLLLAGTQVVQAGLRHTAKGKGVVASSSSVMWKILPVVSIGSGSLQIMKGWHELDSHEGGPLALIHSRSARTGMLQVLAGGLLFFSGVGAAAGGAGLRLAAAANEMDAFSSLDWASSRIENRGERVAGRVYWFDKTPHVAYDVPN